MMDLGSWWILDVIGPVILLLVLIELIIGSNRDVGPKGRSDRGSRELYSKEKRRPREGADES